jgi:predicted kinase
MLTVVSGLPGTGKSAVAAAVAGRSDAVHLSVDRIEDALLGAGVPPGWTTGVAAYEAVRAAAEQNLELGRLVVVDAVNDSEAARSTWRRAASSTSTSVLFILLTPPAPREHRSRLRSRTRTLAHVPEPTWEQVQARAEAFEPWQGEYAEVDSGQRIGEVVERVLRLMSDRP